MLYQKLFFYVLVRFQCVFILLMLKDAILFINETVIDMFKNVYQMYIPQLNFVYCPHNQTSHIWTQSFPIGNKLLKKHEVLGFSNFWIKLLEFPPM